MKELDRKPPVIAGLYINDIRIDEAIRDTFYHYRWKLEQLPASLSGYYHPDDEKEVGGLLLHMKRMIWFINGYCNEFDINNGTKDCMLAAAFFHDISLCEIVKLKKCAKIVDGKIIREILLERKDEDFDYHPIKSAEISRFYLEKYHVSREKVERICNMVSSHMGKWCPFLPQPNTMEEKIIALADFILTRNDIQIVEKNKEKP